MEERKTVKFCVTIIFGICAILLNIGLAFSSDYEVGFNGATRDYGQSQETKEPISAANGAFYFDMNFLLPGGPMDLGFTLFYRSDYSRGFQSLPASFWWRPFGRAVSNFKFEGVEHATVYLPNGDQVSFRKEGTGEWALAGPTVDVGGFVYVDNFPRVKYQLKETANYLYLLDPQSERVYTFYSGPFNPAVSRAWGLLRIEDRNGNALTYTNDPSWPEARPLRVEDGLGRYLDFTYERPCTVPPCSMFLKTVTDQAGRQVVLISEAQGADNANGETLRSVTDPMGNVFTFHYGGDVLLNNLITGKTLPLGNTPYAQTYALKTLYGESFPRVTSQQDAYGNTSAITYDSITHKVTVQNSDGSDRQFKHYSSHGLPETITDETGKTMQFTKSVDEHVTGVDDRMGDLTSFDYDADTGKPLSATNAEGRTLTNTYTSQDQTFTNPYNSEQVTFTFKDLTRRDYPDGTNEQFTYNSKGDVITRIDRTGKAWTFTYNDRGQVLTVINPAGGITTNTYNADATLATVTDSDGVSRGFGYDIYKRLNMVSDSYGISAEMTYDLNDRLTSVTDGNGRAYTYAYDANGNLTKVTDPKGKATRYAYDLMDRVVQITDRLGKDTVFTYDSMERTASITDPNGIVTSFGYDPRGWRNSTTIGGKTRQTGYDDEGVVSSSTTPLGNMTAYQTDKLGFTTGVTNPLGQATIFTRDPMSRVTEITDPLGRATTYGYDGKGLLASVTIPVIGTAAYQRTDLGLLGRITDLKGKDWTFGYSTMGRLLSGTDPLGRTTGHTYDARGRLFQTTYPGGQTLDITYDNAGNVARRLYSAGPNLQYAYDELGRLKTAGGISFTRDAEGRPTSTGNPGAAFGAGYDAGGRLKTATYNNGAFTVTYTYNATTGLLSRVKDNLTGAQVDFTYDNDGRPKSMVRSNGVKTTHTYDKAGRITRIAEKKGSVPLIDLQYSLDASGQVVSVNMTAPLDPSTVLIEGAKRFTYNAASEVKSSGYVYDERGRLTASPGHSYKWDGASRLKQADNSYMIYNGLGDLMTRTENGEKVRFYYNHAIGLKPIMAEKDESTGQFLRYYVWTPEGRLLYMIDASDGNRVYYYHFDRTGSTLALTDSAGTVTDSYAYTPYGKLLGHNGSSQQPFTFVGKYGVRNEGGSGAFYHMRARHYDAVTARFLSRDPVWPVLADSRQLNPYQYVAGNPLLHVDYSGLALTEAEEREFGNLQRILSDPGFGQFYRPDPDVRTAQHLVQVAHVGVHGQLDEDLARQMREEDERLDRLNNSQRAENEWYEKRYKQLLIKKMGVNFFLGIRKGLDKLGAIMGKFKDETDPEYLAYHELFEAVFNSLLSQYGLDAIDILSYDVEEIEAAASFNEPFPE